MTHPAAAFSPGHMTTDQVIRAFEDQVKLAHDATVADFAQQHDRLVLIRQDLQWRLRHNVSRIHSGD